MASNNSTSNPYQVQGPEPFSFSSPSNWPKWKRRFERFRVASGLTSKSEEEQVNTLIYFMGDTADDILLSFGLSAADQKKYDPVLKKFEDHFIVKRNVIYERSRFNSRRQDDGEPVDDFITSLYSLVEHCNYAALKDELIRDRIVVGVRDRQLAQKMQLDDKLTLEKAINMSRQHEAVKKQQRELWGESNSTHSVDRVGSQNHQEHKISQESQEEGQTENQVQQTSCSTHLVASCKFCGSFHRRKKESCRAWGKECKKCKQNNHFAKLCPNQASSSSSQVRSVEVEKQQFFIGTLQVIGFVDTSKKTQRQCSVDLEMRLSSGGHRQSRWIEKVNVDQQEIEFKLDPGADVTVISSKTFSQLWLQPSTRILNGPDGQNLNLQGKFRSRLSFKENDIKKEIFVVSHLDRSLLGLAACEDLNLVKCLNCWDGISCVSPLSEVPEPFDGFGKIEIPYKISLTKDTAPPRKSKR